MKIFIVPFFLFLILFRFFRNSFYFLRPFYTRCIQISRSMFGSDSTIRRTLLHLTSTNGWCTIRETRSTKAKYGPAIAGVGWIVLVSVFLFSSVNIFIRSGCKLSMLQYSSSSLLHRLTLSFSLFLSLFHFLLFFSTSHFRSRSRVTSFFDIVSSRRSRLNVVHGRMVVSTRSLPFALQIVVRYQLIIISFR